MKRFLDAVAPSFALFGPLFIVQSIPGLALWKMLFASIGGFMIGLAVIAVILRQREIEERLDAIDGGELEISETAQKGARIRGAV
ncbi:hypothetical protein [Rubrivirga sp.]|uniref:hypothetical protein n=1 Tax=Rubrivirga sp. TaxID=1885344 RepID=UPI003C7851BA